MSNWEHIEGSLATPRGFRGAAVAAGIKKAPGALDLALIVSNRPASVAGSLTTNRLRAPCVEWADKVLRGGRARAIVANSGNANCCT